MPRLLAEAERGEAAQYTQYCAIKNGLIKNSTGIFGNFKERVLKIFRIKNRFFSLRKIKERSTLRVWKVSEKFGKYPKNSEKIQIFWKKSEFFGKNPNFSENSKKIQKFSKKFKKLKNGILGLRNASTGKT